jgi:Tfp pilus assembly protein FimT
MVRPDRKRCAGFSFMDVLVATALIAILYAVAVPRFRELQGPYASRSAATEIAAAFQAARMRAIATNSNVRLTYNSGTKSYTMDRQISGNWTTEVANQMPTGVTLSASGGTPQFDRTGVLNGAFTVTVTAYGTTRTVSINVLGKTTIS